MRVGVTSWAGLPYPQSPVAPLSPPANQQTNQPTNQPAYFSNHALFNPSLASIIISAGEVPGW